MRENRRLTYILAIAAATVLIVGVIAFAQASRNKPELRMITHTEIVKPVVNLLGSAKPLGVEPKTLQKNDITSLISKDPRIKSALVKLGGIDEINAAQLLNYNGKRLLVIFTKGTENHPVVIDLATGEILPAKIIVIKRYHDRMRVPVNSESRKQIKEMLENLRASGKIKITDQYENSLIANYTRLYLYKEVKATSYQLLVKLNKNRPGYTPLAYYLSATTCMPWYIAGHLVYEVCASGLFYVDPGNAVYVVSDNSYYIVNLPYSNCKFHHSTSATPVSASIRADGEAALLDCPVTTKLSAWAVSTVDKWGNFFPNGGGSKWIAFGCGCQSIPMP